LVWIRGKFASTQQDLAVFKVEWKKKRIPIIKNSYANSKYRWQYRALNLQQNIIP
jgi:hypothetical protein